MKLKVHLLLTVGMVFAANTVLPAAPVIVDPRLSFTVLGTAPASSLRNGSPGIYAKEDLTVREPSSATGTAPSSGAPLIETAAPAVRAIAWAAACFAVPALLVCWKRRTVGEGRRRVL